MMGLVYMYPIEGGTSVLSMAILHPSAGVALLRSTLVGQYLFRPIISA